MPVVVVENVEDFCHESHGQLGIFQAWLKNLDYESTAMILRSGQFLLPQGRVRAYIIGVNVKMAVPGEGQDIQDILKAMTQTVHSLASDYVFPLDSFLLDDTDPAVLAELDRRTKHAKGSEGGSPSWPGEHF
eukprot:44321-Lingulodinium_polyedra.AAC.1